MLSVTQAERLILEHMHDPGTVSVPISEAVGAVLRQTVRAERDQPPFDRVTMDGIAISHAALAAGRRSFHVQGSQGAGQPALPLARPGDCVEIMTGASLPPGTDCVIPVENTQRAGEDAIVGEDVQAERRQFIHPRGSDYREGDVLLEPGITIEAPEMAVLASAGQPEVTVARKPRISILPVGDELVDVGHPVEAFQIRRSNDRMVAAALARRGLTDLTVEAQPDEPAILRERIGEHRDTSDILILSGGVSMGKYDYIPGIMRELGIDVVLHKIAQRPGKPMWFGVHGSGTVVFALPGNPVSSLVCLIRYALPAIHAAMGGNPAPRPNAALSDEVSFRPPLTYFIPVILAHDDTGRLSATPRPTNTSGDFAALAGTSGVLALPADESYFPPGYAAPFFAW